MLDLLVNWSVSALMANLRKHHVWYITQIAMYQPFDGNLARKAGAIGEQPETSSSASRTGLGSFLTA